MDLEDSMSHISLASISGMTHMPNVGVSHSAERRDVDQGVAGVPAGYATDLGDIGEFIPTDLITS
jgi:hypothetical protein